MALLHPLTGVPLPATPPYELGGKLDYAEGRFRFTDVAGRVGRSDVEGAATVAVRPSQRPEVTAELRSRAVDLRDIAGLLGGEGDVEVGAQGRQGNARAPVYDRERPGRRVGRPTRRAV